MEQLDPEFKPLLRKFRLEDLRALSGATYGVWADFRLGYLNPGWFRFAEENHGEAILGGEWGLGTSILESMAAPVRRFYELNLSGCLESGTSWSHDYECSSPTVYRKFRQTAHPLGRQEGLLIVTALAVERAHDEGRRPARAPGAAGYVNDAGFISQCSHCRLVRNVTEPERWDWVPEWVRTRPTNLSHTLCPVCAAKYSPHGD